MKEKLDKLFNMMTLPRDKLSHFFYGFMYFHLFILIMPLGLSVLTVFGLALLKEIIDDKYRNSKFDVLDLVFTCLPAIIYYITINSFI